MTGETPLLIGRCIIFLVGLSGLLSVLRIR